MLSAVFPFTSTVSSLLSNPSLEKATLIVDKITGKINLDINQGSYLGYMDYKNSYYPRMNTVTIKSFSE